MNGAKSFTVMLIVAESEPPELLAQIVYSTAVVCSVVGVPQMLPLVEPKDRPVGRLGLISHDVTVPPLTVGVLVVMVVPFSRVMFSGE